MHPCAYCSVILDSQDVETTLVPINKWMGKDGERVCVCVYTHIYNAILLIHKRKWNLAIYNNMEGNIPSEISQTKTSIACFHLQQIKKKKTNGQT